MSGLSYHSRLKALNLESSELKWLRADLLPAYKILFGLLCVNSDLFSTPRNQSQSCGHAYMLHKQRYFTFNRRNFFSIQIVNTWNSLPAETTDFSGLDKFNKSVSNTFLLNFCQVNFVCISSSDTETYIVCFYVITCTIVLFLSLLCLTVL